MNSVTRRDFFKEICSGESIKGILGAWCGFSSEVKKQTPLSCDEAGALLSRKRAENSLDSRIIKE